MPVPQIIQDIIDAEENDLDKQQYRQQYQQMINRLEQIRTTAPSNNQQVINAIQDMAGYMEKMAKFINRPYLFHSFAPSSTSHAASTRRGKGAVNSQCSYVSSSNVFKESS